MKPDRRRKSRPTLREYLEINDLSYRRASTRLGVDFTTIAHWLAGRRRPNSIAIARMDALGIDWRPLVSDSADVPAAG